MKITLERLNKAKYVFKRYGELQNEIRTAYNTYHSPVFDSSYSRTKNQKSDPVINAVNHLEALNAQLSECLDFMIQFEDDLREIDDYGIRVMIRSHYVLGESWKRCTKRVLGYDGSDTAKKRVFRYIEGMEDKEP